VIFQARNDQGVDVGTTKRVFGQLDGFSVDLYTLTNKQGCELAITNYGGIIQSLKVPDAKGTLCDVVLGFHTLEEYIADNSYLGCLVGRHANRIKEGTFTLEGEEYSLAVNNGTNHLHGGIRGFNKVIWHAKELKTKNGPGLELTYISRDGEEGYPGNLEVRVVYILTEANELFIDYYAETDKTTIVNLTNHSYFNLSNTETILDHEVRIDSDCYTPVGEEMVPTGHLKSTSDTSLDFSELVEIGKKIEKAETSELSNGGFDHNFIINEYDGEIHFAAQVRSAQSGIKMDVFTTEPGLQLYTGNFFDGSQMGKSGKMYQQFAGLCLEAQKFPDSMNHPDFPSVVLEPGDAYVQTTIYSFNTI